MKKEDLDVLKVCDTKKTLKLSFTNKFTLNEKITLVDDKIIINNKEIAKRF